MVSKGHTVDDKEIFTITKQQGVCNNGTLGLAEFARLIYPVSEPSLLHSSLQSLKHAFGYNTHLQVPKAIGDLAAQILLQEIATVKAVESMKDSLVTVDDFSVVQMFRTID